MASSCREEKALEESNPAGRSFSQFQAPDKPSNHQIKPIDNSVERDLPDGIQVQWQLLSSVELSRLRIQCDTALEYIFQFLPSEEDFVRSSGCILQPINLASMEAVEPLRSRDYASNWSEYCRMRKLVIPTDSASRLEWLPDSIIKTAAHFLSLESGATVYLFDEQFICKPPLSSDSAFQVHTDSEGMIDVVEDADALQYVSAWIPLDDIDSRNGCLFVVSSEGSQVMLEPLHAADAVLIGCQASHGSAPNRSRTWRRAYMPQFSAKPIRNKCGELLALALPLIVP